MEQDVLLKKFMDLRAQKILSEEVEYFEAETQDGKRKKYTIYPFQLARLSLISNRLIELDLALDNCSVDSINAMWTICSNKPRKVAEIIAIATLRTKEDIDNLLDERTNELLWSPTMTPEAMTNILYTIIYMSYYQDFMKAIRLVKIISVEISPAEHEKRIAMEGIAFGDN